MAIALAIPSKVLLRMVLLSAALFDSVNSSKYHFGKLLPLEGTTLSPLPTMLVGPPIEKAMWKTLQVGLEM